MENKKLLPIAIIILAMSGIFGSTEYLNMTEEEVRAIIQTEKKKLDETHSFEGKMFPYFTINNKQYFYKDEIDEWLKEVWSTCYGVGLYLDEIEHASAILFGEG